METDDLSTIAAVAGMSFVVAVGLHEHLGHATTCALTTCDLTKLGAFYVDYRPGSLQGTAKWLVPATGPLVSLVVGVGSLLLFKLVRASSSLLTKVVLWHFFTVNLMIGAGYLLFSGFSGRGDLGHGTDEALHGRRPEALWQILLIILGGLAYLAVMKNSVRMFASIVGGAGEQRVKRAQRLSLVAYISGVVVALAIGLLNPEGATILVVSAAMSSIGGTSGLGWMMLQFLDRKSAEEMPPSPPIKRNVRWIALAAIVVVGYAAIFGPTLTV